VGAVSWPGVVAEIQISLDVAHGCLLLPDINNPAATANNSRYTTSLPEI
jgi:hypothetical protein